MNISFDKKRVLVTGAGRGIGYEITKSFVENGAEKVFALSKTKSNLEKLAAESSKIVPVCVDLADWDATKTAVESVGPIDILVNNAGVFIPESFLKAKPESFDVIFNVNVKSVINISQIVAAGMIERKQGGVIINVSSQASQVAVHDCGVYGASKAAIDSLTRAMALELGQHKIRVNAVNPTLVWTDMTRDHWSDSDKAKELLDRIPLHKFAEVSDVVNAILFLASEKAGMINAATVPLEGGYWAC